MILFKNTPFQINFKYELSYILIPFSALLYYYAPSSRSILLFHMVIIGLIGINDALSKYKKKENAILPTIGSLIFHTLLLIVLKDLFKYKSNILSLLLLLVANIIIIYLPYWPYILNKNKTILLYNSIYLSLLFIQMIG